MDELRGWIIFSWIAIPTVMFGGYSLLRLLTEETETTYRARWFRAGHAHAGVLLTLSLLYFLFLDMTALSTEVKHAGSATFIVGQLAQSGGFFVHMVRGQANRTSIGTTVTVVGALLLALAMALLVYGLFTMP